MKFFFSPWPLLGLLLCVLSACNDPEDPSKLNAAFTTTLGTTKKTGLYVVFINSSIDNPAGTVYTWDFGDGATSDLVSPTHTYATVGDKTVTLTASSAGQSISVEQTLKLGDKKQTASFTRIIKGLTVKFTRLVENASSNTWYFGDGKSTFNYPQNEISHTYDAYGTYIVTLIAKAEPGVKPDILTASDTIFVIKDDLVNLLKGGGMEKVDSAYWNNFRTNVSAPANANFGVTGAGANYGVDGAFQVTDKAGVDTEGSVFFQKVFLAAGDYIFSAAFKGSSGGASNFWVEFYVDPNEPIINDPYDKSTLIGGINSIAVPAANSKTNLNGSFILSAKGLDDPSKKLPGVDDNGKFTIATDGFYYVVLKVGKSNGKYGTGGIYVDEIKLNRLK